MLLLTTVCILACSYHSVRVLSSGGELHLLARPAGMLLSATVSTIASLLLSFMPVVDMQSYSGDPYYGALGTLAYGQPSVVSAYHSDRHC